jgi:hypothetical protein
VNLLALLLGWLIARTVRVVPADQFSPPPPPPPPPSPPGGGGRRPHTRPHVPRAATPRGSTVPASLTAPWPQVVPAGLPSFPGGGWVPDSPPPPDVVARASALLQPLWRGGAGTFKTEKIGARWITFRATDFPGGKRGVVAYRLANPQASAASPASAPTVTPGPTLLATHASSPVGLPTLRRGARGEDVKILQRRLGIHDDGIFGPGTEAAVRSYQAAKGLFVDGVVGRNTWGALMGRAA